MRRLGLAALEHVDSIHVWDNIALPVCEFQELFGRTADVEHQDGNDDDGTCE
jgi:hypothetical protein